MNSPVDVGILMLDKCSTDSEKPLARFALALDSEEEFDQRNMLGSPKAVAPALVMEKMPIQALAFL